MKKSKSLVVGGVSVSACIVLGYLAGRAHAAGIPAAKTMTYSGTLTDMNGAPLTGMKNIQVQLWDAPAAGVSQCLAGPTAVTLAAGGFEMTLPDGCTAAVHANPDLYVEVFVDGASTGRTKLGAVPYAVEADHAQTAASATNATSATNASHATTADSATTATSATNATHAATADSATTASALSSGVILGTAVNGQLAASASTTQTLTLASNGTYFVTGVPVGASTDVHQTYLVHSPYSGNLNVAPTPLLANSFSMGSIQAKAQDGGVGYGYNPSSGYVLQLTFAAGTNAASWSYSVTRLL